MKKPQYRIKEYDPIHDMYVLQKKGWIFWQNLSVASRKACEDYINTKLNEDKGS